MTTEVAAKPKAAAKPRAAKAEYMEAVGRRKTAVARVRASSSAKAVYTVNGKTVEEYFPTAGLRDIVQSPITREGVVGKYSVSAMVKGGGIHAQAEAIRHGLSRILVEEDATQKKELKKLGYLKRDPRTVERKHFGLKKARKASQWSKR